MPVKPSNPQINRSHPLARGLVGAWAFQDGGGATLRDVSGHGRDGTFGGTPTWISSERGGALDFTGGTNTDYIDLGNKADYKPAAGQGISFSAWARPDTLSGWDCVYGHRNSGTSSAITLFRGAAGQFDIAFLSNGRADGTAESIAGVFAAGVWVHLVAVRRSDGQVDGYVNGVKTTLSYTCSGAIDDQDESACIGRHTYDTAQDWDGQIQDFRIWSRALADSEVIDLYVGDDLYSPAIGIQERYYLLPLPRPPIAEKGVAGGPGAKAVKINRSHPLARGLVGAWAFQDGGGSVLRDVSGHGNDGVLTNMDAATVWVADRYGGALDFDGSNDHVLISDSPSLRLTALTISLWVKTSMASGVYRGVLEKFTGSTAGYAIHVPSGSAGVPRFSVQTPSDVDVDATTAINDGEFHHVVASFDSSARRIYVDGVLEGSGAGGTIVTDSHDLFFAGDGASTFHSDIVLSDVKIWSRALSANEVIASYVSGDDLYSPAVGIQERYYRANAPIGAIGTGLHAIEAGGVYGAPGINSGLHAIGTGVVTA